jgi:hypothetical protein
VRARANIQVVSVDGCTTSAPLRVATLFAACSVVIAIPAYAGPAVQTLVSLEYEIATGTDGCPDATRFRATVERQLGYDPFRASADKHVVVWIARKDVGFEGRIRWSDAEGQQVGDRRLSSRHGDCDEIAASVAFSVAVQIQLLGALAPPPIADARAPPAEPATPPEPSVTPPERPAEPAPIEVEAPVAPPAPASRFRLSIGAGPSLAVGVAPRAVGLGRLFASGRAGHFSLELAGDAALPVTQQDASGKGFTLDRFAAEAAACGHVAVFAACVTGTVGRLQAHGLGVDMREAPSGWFSQLGARLAAAYDFSDRYFAAARVDGLVMTAPTHVTLNDSVVWTTPRVGAVLGLDVGAHFF